VTPRPFLSAFWSQLVLLTFEVPDALVRAHLPRGAEPDYWRGATHATLVALQLRDVRVRGWRIPGFTAYPQVNFRVYTRHGADAAVAFVRELVPNRVIAAVARLRYGEPFRVARIEASVADRADGVSLEYRFGPARPCYRVAVTASHAAAVPRDSSIEHHLLERTIGCHEDRVGRLRVFPVAHAPWAVRTVSRVAYDVDFAALFGPEWALLSGRTPVSTIVAVGSAVAVGRPEWPAAGRSANG
jgi:uncharacterized protein YqjF (DUF2071 family)